MGVWIRQCLQRFLDPLAGFGEGERGSKKREGKGKGSAEEGRREKRGKGREGRGRSDLQAKILATTLLIVGL